MSFEQTVYPTIAMVITVKPRDDPDQLRVTLESLFAQDSPLDQLVLLVDGTLLPKQRNVIAAYKHDPHIRAIEVIAADDRNVAETLNLGVERCSTEWIGFLRVGDAAPPDRVTTQRDYIARRQTKLDVIGGWVEDRLQQGRVRSCPVTHDAILQCLRWQSVLFDGSVIFRAASLRAVGGYRNRFARLETWDICVRLALAKATFAVIPKALVETSATRDNRRGLGCLIVDMRFQTFCWISGFISTRQYLVSLPGQAVFRLVAPMFSAREPYNEEVMINA